MVCLGLTVTIFEWCLPTRPHYCARPMRFGSRGPFVPDTSLKCIDREGLERPRIGTKQEWCIVCKVANFLTSRALKIIAWARIKYVRGRKRARKTREGKDEKRRRDCNLFCSR